LSLIPFFSTIKSTPFLGSFFICIASKNFLLLPIISSTTSLFLLSPWSLREDDEGLHKQALQAI
jgi:hypothetical protein